MLSAADFGRSKTTGTSCVDDADTKVASPPLRSRSASKLRRNSGDRGSSGDLEISDASFAAREIQRLWRGRRDRHHSALVDLANSVNAQEQATDAALKKAGESVAQMLTTCVFLKFFILIKSIECCHSCTRNR